MGALYKMLKGDEDRMHQLLSKNIVTYPPLISSSISLVRCSFRVKNRMRGTRIEV